jgi:hypothetical protein
MSSVKTVPFSSLHTKYATKASIDVTRAAKLNRSFIRSNFDAIVKAWPELSKSQKINRDNNRYPTTIPAPVAEAILSRDVTKLGKVRKPRTPKQTTSPATTQEVTNS